MTGSSCSSGKSERPLSVLHATPLYWPFVGGLAQQVQRVSEHLVSIGHEVTVATAALASRTATELNGVRIVEFDVDGSLAWGVTGEGFERYLDFLRTSEFDVIVGFQAPGWSLDGVAQLAGELPGVKIWSPIGLHGSDSSELQDYFTRLRDQLSEFDAGIFLSGTTPDFDWARAAGLRDLRVIPNGASRVEFGDVDRSDEGRLRAELGIKGFLVLTVGSHTGMKGHRESLLAYSLAPIFRRSTLLIVGNEVPGERDRGCSEWCQLWARRLRPLLRLQGKRVLVLELERRDTVRVFKAADLVLFLSRREGSPLVLFEAAASATPFVASGAGNSAEIAQWTGAGVVARGRELSRNRVQTNVVDAAMRLAYFALRRRLRQSMGRRGREAWLAEFTWEEIGRRYVDLYADLARR